MPNVVDKLRTFFDAPIPGQTIEEFLDNAIAMGIKPGGDVEVMTTTEFDEYLESKGWHKGPYTETYNGQTYNVGSKYIFGVPNYPRSAFPSLAKAEQYFVVYDGVTRLYIGADMEISSGAATPITLANLGQTTTKQGFVLISLSSTTITITQVTLGDVRMSTTTNPNFITHGRPDLDSIIINRYGIISIKRGNFITTQPNEDSLPGLQFTTGVEPETVRLTKNRLSSLLALLDADSLPAVTSDDNGKVLTVVDGEWNKAEAGGESPYDLLLNIVLTLDTSTTPAGYIVQINATNEEIQTAVSSGALIGGKVSLTTGSATNTYPITAVTMLLGNPSLGRYASITGARLSLKDVYDQSTSTTAPGMKLDGYTIEWNPSSSTWTAKKYEGTFQF